MPELNPNERLTPTHQPGNTPSTHHVLVYKNTVLLFDPPYYVRCITCEPVFRVGFRTKELAEAYAEEHRKAHPYVMSEETFEQRLEVIARALTGMNADRLEIVQAIVTDHLTNALTEEAQ